MITIEQNLKQIEEWLLIHAPKIVHESLNPPATLIQLEQLEKTIQKPLPEDFKALFLWHNGLKAKSENSGNLFYGLDFFDLEFIEKNYLEVKNSQDDVLIKMGNVDPGINPINHRNPLWIKFGYDWSRCSIALDLNPIAPEKYGQIIFIDYDYDAVLLVAHSTEELVQTFLNDLHANRYYLNEEALEDGNHFIDCLPEIDLINWKSKKNQRWKRMFNT